MTWALRRAYPSLTRLMKLDLTEVKLMSEHKKLPSHAHLHEAHKQVQSAAELIHELLHGPEPADPLRLELAAGLLKKALSRMEPPKL